MAFLEYLVARRWGYFWGYLALSSTENILMSSVLSDIYWCRPGHHATSRTEHSQLSLSSVLSQVIDCGWHSLARAPIVFAGYPLRSVDASTRAARGRYTRHATTSRERRFAASAYRTPDRTRPSLFMLVTWPGQSRRLVASWRHCRARPRGIPSDWPSAKRSVRARIAIGHTRSIISRLR